MEEPLKRLYDSSQTWSEQWYIQQVMTGTGKLIQKIKKERKKRRGVGF